MSCVIMPDSLVDGSVSILAEMLRRGFFDFSGRSGSCDWNSRIDCSRAIQDGVRWLILFDSLIIAPNIDTECK